MENVTSEDAQAIIIAAFLIAIGVLVLSSLLNGLIFSQNLATRDDGAEERSILEFSQGAEEAVRVAMTGNRTTPNDAKEEFERFMHLYEEEMISRYKSRQRAVSFGPTGPDSDLNFSDPGVDSTLAWAVGQRCGVGPGSGTCNFTNVTGAEDWRVINSSEAFNNPGEPYKLVFNITKPAPGDVFEVNATDATTGFTVPPPFTTDGWRMRVNNDTIEFDEDGLFGGGTSYKWDDLNKSYARIEVMEDRINNRTQINSSTVNTQDQALDSNIAQMIFDNGDVVEGSYDIRIDKDTESGGPPREIQGPCQTTPAVCELAQNSSSDRDLYAVGIVHQVEGVKANYAGSEATYTTEISMTLRQEDLILEER